MTRERCKELLPVIQAFAEGKAIEYRTDFNTPWTLMETSTFEGRGDYRIKPEKRRVPLEPQDVPPGSAVHYSMVDFKDEWQMVVSVCEKGIEIHRSLQPVDVVTLVTFQDLKSGGWQIKRPGEDWKPCYRELSFGPFP